MFEEKMIVEDGANGAIPDVLICPVGQFVGSDANGDPVPQNFTQESLESIAENLNQSGKEILCDADHASAKGGLDRNTRAVGWFSNFVANAKGLFGLLKLTKWGRELIANREYRSVSPVFKLNGDSEPTALLSVASTNTPALAVPENVILNTEPEQSNSEEKIHMDMTKEELVELIKTTVTSLNQTTVAVNQEGDSVSLNQGKESCNEKGTCETPDETEEKTEVEETTEVEEEVEEEKKEATEEVAEEKTEVETTEVEDEYETTEVVKEEVLNTAPATTVPTVEEEWKQLNGEDFRKWCAEHAQFCNSYKA